MQRAAGIAAACAELLGRMYGSGVVLLVGRGNGGTPSGRGQAVDSHAPATRLYLVAGA